MFFKKVFHQKIKKSFAQKLQLDSIFKKKKIEEN